MPDTSPFARKYSAGLALILGRKLEPTDGLPKGFVLEAETKLKLKIPAALCEYYLVAGRLGLNQEHNRLYSPANLEALEGKLIFMEENQCVVFWGIDLETVADDDPEVFQANNEKPIVWYSEELPFSEFILKMWRWQRGLDAGK